MTNLTEFQRPDKPLSGVQMLAALSELDRQEFLESLSQKQSAALLYDWRGFNARPNQIAPDGDWDIWIALAGRGFGKTKMGAEWIREREAAGARRFAFVAETAADARDVMVEGPSGILSVYPKGEEPLYESSKRRLTWPSGAVATLFNATEPDQLRGPQFDCAWCDELAKFRYARATWDQLQMGLRMGDDPKQIITTTPRPIELIKAIIAGDEGHVVITHGKTIDNASNLAPKFMRKILKRYEGTRLGRQELDAEILSDIPNALWTLTNIDLFRQFKTADEIRALCSRIVVSVDPAVTSTEDSDYHGILVQGMAEKDGYVLEDASIKGTPEEWARAAISCYDRWDADCIVVEVNQGGDMVASTLKTIRANIPIKEVRATRGKHVRAEPISSLYQQGRIHHIGAFVELENQMTLMSNEGYEGEGSPDRVDALVWGMTELFPSMIREPVKREPITSTKMRRLRRLPR